MTTDLAQQIQQSVDQLQQAISALPQSLHQAMVAPQPAAPPAPVASQSTAPPSPTASPPSIAPHVAGGPVATNPPPVMQQPATSPSQPPAPQAAPPYQSSEQRDWWQKTTHYDKEPGKLFQKLPNPFQQGPDGGMPSLKQMVESTRGKGKPGFSVSEGDERIFRQGSGGMGGSSDKMEATLEQILKELQAISKASGGTGSKRRGWFGGIV